MVLCFVWCSIFLFENAVKFVKSVSSQKVVLGEAMQVLKLQGGRFMRPDLVKPASFSQLTYTFVFHHSQTFAWVATWKPLVLCWAWRLLQVSCLRSVISYFLIVVHPSNSI